MSLVRVTLLQTWSARIRHKSSRKWIIDVRSLNVVERFIRSDYISIFTKKTIDRLKFHSTCILVIMIIRSRLDVPNTSIRILLVSKFDMNRRLNFRRVINLARRRGWLAFCLLRDVKAKRFEVSNSSIEWH